VGHLIAAAVSFAVLHLLVAGTTLRDRIITVIDERAYLGLFSLATFAVLGWLAWSYSHAFSSSANAGYWTTPTWLKWTCGGLVLLAMLAIIVGLTTPNPTAVQQEKLLDTDEPARGALRITRHPFLWGIALWSVAHITANGDRASLVLFSTFLIVAVAGTTSIDHKRRRRYGASWDAFARKTSNLPFAAILSGRNTLRIGEIGTWRIALALAVYAGVVLAHPWLFGAAPLPWRPF
jgi:uncharacterized membrane protein